MVPTHRDHQILPYSQGQAARCAAHMQPQPAAAARHGRQTASSPTCKDLTIMDTGKPLPYDPALAGLYVTGPRVL